jgi:DNA-binding GntR family transcriptional regulator
MTAEAGPLDGVLGGVTTQSRIVEVLRERIMTGELEVGERLRQVDLSEELGVSTTPVREAFRSLAGEGLLRIDSHRGAVVRTTTLAERIEIMELLRCNEGDNLEHAVPRMTAAHLDADAAVQEELRSTPTAARWAILNRDFHWELDRASGRPQATSLVLRLLNQSALHIVGDIEQSRARRAEALDEHDALLAACRAGDVETARRVLWQHTSSSLENLRRQAADG